MNDAETVRLLIDCGFVAGLLGVVRWCLAVQREVHAGRDETRAVELRSMKRDLFQVRQIERLMGGDPDRPAKPAALHPEGNHEHRWN